MAGVPKEEHESLDQWVTSTQMAIESMRDSEIARTGLDPFAVEMLPELVLYNQ